MKSDVERFRDDLAKRFPGQTIHVSAVYCMREPGIKSDYFVFTVGFGKTYSSPSIHELRKVAAAMRKSDG